MTCPQIRRSGPPPQEAADAIAAAESTGIPCQYPQPAQSVPRPHRLACWRRRHDAAVRLVPLDCGCPDPWACRCTEPPLTERAVDGYRDAAEHILSTTGKTPVVPVEVLRALHRRGGDDRALAALLHAAAGGAVA
jgi:hypothetical protein